MSSIVGAREGNIFSIEFKKGIYAEPKITVRNVDFNLDSVQGTDIEVLKAFKNYLDQYIKQLESVDRTKIQQKEAFSSYDFHNLKPSSYSGRYLIGKEKNYEQLHIQTRRY